jgi:hypothetical protein
MDNSDIQKLAKEQGRNEEAELAAFKAGQDYYMLSGVAEQHEQELTKILNDSLRTSCNQTGMDKYLAQAKELVKKLSVEAGLDPEEEEKLFLGSARDICGNRIWPKKRIRALWWRG